MVIDGQQLFFNPLDPDYPKNPWPHLAEMRENLPVHQLLTGGWALFGYDDVFRLLRDPDLSVDDKNADFGASNRAQLLEAGGEDRARTSILGIDPPDHTRLRRLISQAFTPRTIEALRPRVQELVNDKLDRFESAGGGDVIAELAFPLPFDVISEMLGMPEGDKDQIRDWSGAIVKTLDPVLADEEIQAALAADVAMDTHLTAVIEWKRNNPADDILTAMIEAEDGGDRMSAEELGDQVSLLFIAGHETTVNLIGTGIWELLRHPAQLDALREDPSLDVGAIDELLRFVSPVQFSRRIATADLDFGEITIPDRQFIQAGLASANRDPARFGPTADELDIRRSDAGQHVAFGSGIHHCLGASLAKLEAQVAIGTFIRRFPDAFLDGEPEWNGRINLRGLETLPMRVRGEGVDRVVN